MRNQRLGSRSLAILLSLVMACVAAPALASDTVTVDVGRESTMVSFDAMFPGVTYVHAGDSITFANKAQATPHTVTFAAGGQMPTFNDPTALAPSQKSGGSWDGTGLLNSGIMEPGSSYSVTFTKEGIYEYACILHPLMKGQVVVLPAGIPVPKAEAQHQMGDMQHHDHMAQAEAVTSDNEGRLPVGKVNADGTVTWQVLAGAGLQSFTVNQFFPQNLVVSEGDTVDFPNGNVYEFHFVTFPTSPADQGKFFGPHGPDVVALMTPAGGSVVDGSQMVHSGGIFPKQSKSFTFPKAGTYKFYCYIHGGSHMEGTIVVQAKNTVHAYVNGKPLMSADSRAPHMHGSHVYVSLRSFVDALGASVAWDEASQTVSVVTGGGKAEAKAADGDGIKVVINGKPLKFDYTPGIHQHEGRTYVPAQELVTALGGQMMWDSATQTLMMEVR